MKLNQLIQGFILSAMSLSCFQLAYADEYTALFKDKKYAEIEKIANSKLTIEPNNPSALNAKINLIINQDKEAKIEDGIKLAERCIEANPKSTICYESLGNILGTKALKGSLFSAATYAGKIRDSFKKAVELDPKNISARSSLLQFYLQAPSIMGGGKEKAQDLVISTIKIMPAVGALLQARMDLQDDNVARAESAALVVNANGDDEVITMQKNILTNIGHFHLRAKKYDQAIKMFVEIGRRYPDFNGASYGLGRTYQEQGHYKEAIAQFEKSLSLESNAYSYYRIAQALQSVNDKIKAISAYEKAISFMPSLGKKEKSDAQDQLKQLKSSIN